MRYIEQLLTLIDDGGAVDEARVSPPIGTGCAARSGTPWPPSPLGVPPESLAPAVQEREAEIARIVVKIRQPRAVPIDRERGAGATHRGLAAGA